VRVFLASRRTDPELPSAFVALQYAVRRLVRRIEDSNRSDD
jgi:hypothetical protein